MHRSCEGVAGSGSRRWAWHPRAATRLLGVLGLVGALGACTTTERDACEPYQDPVVPGAGATPNHVEWMTELTCRRPDRELTLRDLCWPRSHDAGTYTQTSCLFEGSANACNTRTQARTMAGQLAAGVRAFDVRVQRVSPGDFGVVEVLEPRYFTHHTTYCGGLGCIGTPFDELLAELRAFLDEHRELVLLELGHFCRTDVEDQDLLALIEDTLGDRLYREPEGETRPLVARPLASILPQHGHRGRAIVVYEGQADDLIARRAGRFSTSFLPVDSGWSNVTDVALLHDDQVSRYTDYVPDGSHFFELSWTLTQDTDMALACAVDPETATSIEDLATLANAELGPTLDALVASGEIRPGKIPNVLAVDFTDETTTDECLRITGLNLE